MNTHKELRKKSRHSLIVYLTAEAFIMRTLLCSKFLASYLCIYAVLLFHPSLCTLLKTFSELEESQTVCQCFYNVDLLRILGCILLRIYLFILCIYSQEFLMYFYIVLVVFIVCCYFMNVTLSI